MRVRKLDTSLRQDYRQFAGFPFELYRDDPLWVPPLESEMKLVFDRSKHPFYRHSTADFFVAESEGQTLGRIAILHHRNYSDEHKIPTGFIYYFECVNDLQAAGALLETAHDWARQRGLQEIIGPKGFLRSSGIGLLVEGFEYRPAIGIPYNPPYYAAFLENAGFSKVTDHLSGILTKDLTLEPRVYEVAEKVKLRNRFWIKTFASKSEMRAWAPRIERVHHQAFRNNPGYYPTTPEEFTLMADNMISVADPRLVKLIMRDEDIVGFVIAYADISAALQKSRGRLWPIGWYYIMREFKRTKSVNLNGLGLLPEYQGLGSNALLYTEVEKTLRQFNFDNGEIVQVDETNYKSRSDMETLGVRWIKRHRTYHFTF
jgi:GNAT superfamily N-acetyltransferase